MKRLFWFVTFLFIVQTISFAQEADGLSLEQKYKNVFNEGVDAFDKGDNAKAEEKFKEAIGIDPQGNSIYFNLALAEFNLKKFEEAAQNFFKSVDLGFVPPAEYEMAFKPYKYREFSLTWPGGYQIQFKGSSNCSKQLAMDMLPGVVAYAEKVENIILIRPKFIQWGENGKYWKEEWVMDARNGSKTFSMTLTPTPDGGADYLIAPK